MKFDNFCEIDEKSDLIDVSIPEFILKKARRILGNRILKPSNITDISVSLMMLVENNSEQFKDDYFSGVKKKLLVLRILQLISREELPKSIMMILSTVIDMIIMFDKNRLEIHEKKQLLNSKACCF